MKFTATELQKFNWSFGSSLFAQTARYAAFVFSSSGAQLEASLLPPHVGEAIEYLKRQ